MTAAGWQFWIDARHVHDVWRAVPTAASSPTAAFENPEQYRDARCRYPHLLGLAADAPLADGVIDAVKRGPRGEPTRSRAQGRRTPADNHKGFRRPLRIAYQPAQALSIRHIRPARAALRARSRSMSAMDGRGEDCAASTSSRHVAIPQQRADPLGASVADRLSLSEHERLLSRAWRARSAHPDLGQPSVSPR